MIRMILVSFLFGSFVIEKAQSASDNALLDGNARPEQAKLKLLQEKLDQAKLSDEKLAILKEMSSKDQLEKQAVLDYFNSLPPLEVSTNPNSDYFKVAVFEIVLPLLEGNEQKTLIENVIDDEIRNMRQPHNQKLANMYPMSLWRKMAAVIEAHGTSWDMKERLSSISTDQSLPSQVRSLAYKCSMKNELDTNEDTAVNKIQDILKTIPYMPETSIPWEYFNDKEKYKAYNNNIVYVGERKKVKDWREAGKEVIYEGQLEYLKSHGLKAVEQIVLMLERADVSLERLDGLAEVAADILSTLRVLSPLELELADQLVGKLAHYIDKMEDKGAFCKRYYAIQGLSLYFDHMKIEGYQFKQGLNARVRDNILITPSTKVPLQLTNNLSIVGFPIATNLLKKQEQSVAWKDKERVTVNNNHRVVYAVLLSFLALGFVFIIFWHLKRQK